VISVRIKNTDEGANDAPLLELSRGSAAGDVYPKSRDPVEAVSFHARLASPMMSGSVEVWDSPRKLVGFLQDLSRRGPAASSRYSSADTRLHVDAEYSQHAGARATCIGRCDHSEVWPEGAMVLTVTLTDYFIDWTLSGSFSLTAAELEQAADDVSHVCCVRAHGQKEE
jgi:hypothetical protein